MNKKDFAAHEARMKKERRKFWLSITAWAVVGLVVFFATVTVRGSFIGVSYLVAYLLGTLVYAGWLYISLKFRYRTLQEAIYLLNEKHDLVGKAEVLDEKEKGDVDWDHVGSEVSTATMFGRYTYNIRDDWPTKDKK